MFDERVKQNKRQKNISRVNVVIGSQVSMVLTKTQNGLENTRTGVNLENNSRGKKNLFSLSSPVLTKAKG